MTDLKRLLDAMARADHEAIRQLMGYQGQCLCEGITGLRCKDCGAWVCEACLKDHQNWHKEEANS